ncbi:Biopolymer transport protein ExbD/TolR [Novipirellula galeiformis]|uniref:Biopolymer transport protein ExbD/TolR n=1 Tax=Novipirellula galeiformis TaxID=2528004 RepID=A0A5C6CIL9_9BACT|nr:biopolymer transporter ExbD [Novipirellula galeiformis]TWU24152.1 Biopolymer transport protein ExbD/TolR [Novipirellula galeiformis]
MKVPLRRSQGSLDVEMTPMIDVVFLLLVFFVWTSSFEQPEFDLPSAVAQPPTIGTRDDPADAPPIEIFDELIVRMIAREGGHVIELNGQPVRDTGELESRLKEILKLGVQPPVIVDPEPNIAIAEAILVYDIARVAGADRVLFAANAE